MNVLFVCSRNKWRSLTSETIYKNTPGLAKSSYHCITDPENFNEIADVLRYKTSRDELDNFVKENGE